MASLLVSLSLFSSVSQAQDADTDPPEKSPAPIYVHFSYAAPPRCPKEEKAFSLVHRRTERVVRGNAETAAQELTMRLSKSKNGFRGELIVVRAGRSPERRAMTGGSCREVVEALALTAALSIDPEATLTLGSVGSEDLSEGQAGGDENRRVSTPESNRSGSTPGTGGPSADADSSNRSGNQRLLLRPEQPSSRRSTVRTGGGASGENEPTRSAIAPIVSLAKIMDTGLHLGAGLTFFLGRGQGTRIFPTETRFSLLGLIDLSPREAPSIHANAYLVQLSYCPLRVGTRLAFLICPTGELGLLNGRSNGLSNRGESTRLYGSVGGETWLRAEFAKNWDLWVNPALRVPLTERRYKIEPSPEITASTVELGWSISAGISLLL